MKDHLLDLALAATVLAIALGYYFGHDFIKRVMVDGPMGLMQLAAR